MKISVITAVYNREDTIAQSILSTRSQTYPEVEHVIIDGASDDCTLEVAKRHAAPEARIISEPDKGIYDALNKGIRVSSGDVIGVMHSDDEFSAPSVLQLIADAFADPAVDMVYGDLDYVSRDGDGRVVRRWRSEAFRPNLLSRGWMPPHPTLYLRRSVYEKFGLYDTRYRISADYDMILRILGSGTIKSVYIPQILVNMRVGGASNRSLSQIIRKSQEDYLVLRSNKLGGLVPLVLKNVVKIGQFFPGKAR